MTHLVTAVPRPEYMAGNTRPTYLPKQEPGLIFPAQRTALLVIDPVNDFLSEGGAAWDLTENTVKMNDVVGHLRQAIEGARASGVHVFFGPMAYTEEDYMIEQLQRRSSINRVMFERRMFLAGSWGADFHPDLQPGPQDTLLLPHKSCDVFQTDLPGHLEGRGITHLVIAGMAANLCCESTGRHAMEEGFDVTFLSDAIGATSIPEYEAAVRLNLPLISNAVITVKEFLAALGGSAIEGTGVEAGDIVRGSDHGEIGTVKEVIKARDGTDAYLLVPRGLIFKSDTYIPVEAVVKRIGTDIFINVPKLIVGTMPWAEVPTSRSSKGKHGPPEDQVDRLYGSYFPTMESDDSLS